MASFIPGRQTVGFSPYISTVNPELYGKIIMQKQSMYDQGVQRVQQYIDNTTGLKVGREIDQQYLNSKIDELKSNVNNIAGSDFSKYDTIRQAGQFAANIYNDRRVQGAVISAHNAANINKQLAEAKANGDYADSNAYPLMEAMQNWQNGDENATLGSLTYTPYYNWSTDFQKYMKEVNPHVMTEQSSVTGTDGKPLMYVMKDGKRTLLTEQEAQSHFAAFMSQNQKAAMQMNLDANYYAKTSNQDFQSIISDKYTRRQNSLEESIKQLKEEKALKSGDNELVRQYDTKINEYNLLLQKIPSELADDLERLRTDPYSVKANYYKENLSKQASSRFVRDDQEYKIVEDPYQKALFERDKESFDQKMEMLKFDQKEREIALKEGEAERKRNALPSLGNASWNQSSMVDNIEYGASQYETDMKEQNDAFKQRAAALLVDVYGNNIDYVKRGENGNFIITDQKKAGQALGKIKADYDRGLNGMKDKGYVRQYFEEEGGTGWKAWDALEIQQKQWNDIKNKKQIGSISSNIAKDLGIPTEDLDKPVLDPNNPYSSALASEKDKEIARTVTNRDLLTYYLQVNTGDKLLTPDKEKAVKTYQQNFSYNPYGFGKTADVLSKYGEQYKTIQKELNQEAKNLATARAYPSLVLSGGGKEEGSFQLGLGKVMDYFYRSATGDKKKEYEDVVESINEANKGEGKVKMSINKNPINGEYSVTILGGKKPFSGKIPESIAADFSPYFTQPQQQLADEAKLNHNFNYEKNRYETGDYTAKSNINKDYTFSYNIYKANSGGNYMEVKYRKNGREDENWIPIPDFSMQSGSVADLKSQFERLLQLSKEQFENEIKK